MGPGLRDRFRALIRASVPLQAISVSPSEETPSQGVELGLESLDSLPAGASQPAATTPAAAPAMASAVGNNGMEDYARLKQRLILATLIVSAAAVALTAVVFDLPTAGSVLVGALAGVLYLWLLARSVNKLGNGSKKVSKIQLLVPAVLVLAGSRFPQLELLPAILGFLLYKPALILQALFDS